MQYHSYSDWRKHIEQAAILPKGFQSARTQCQFVAVEKPEFGNLNMNMGLISLDRPTESFAAVFTKNQFPGWPVIAGRRLLDEPAIAGVLVNNKISNVGVAGGLTDTQNLANAVQRAFGGNAPYFSFSTGIIGWRLPVGAMIPRIAQLPQSVQSDTLMPFAEAIMTTDAWPKIRSLNCAAGRITGTAKGAGMVEPNMATMLAFILTDIDVPRTACTPLLKAAVNSSFNRISIDGETSTSDSVLLISSRREPWCGEEEFFAGLRSVCSGLAEDVVRNGEGCGHVFKTTVTGAPSEETALRLARAVVNAPLTKTAIHGNDPNVGRIIQTLGAAAARMDLPLNRESLRVEIDGVEVFSGGAFHLSSREEAILHKCFKEAELPLPVPDWPRHEKRIEVHITLGMGDASDFVIGSDLSTEYVGINADYRS